MEIFDAGTKAWSGLPPRGMEYWERLDEVIQREPLEARDIFFHAMLRPLGLEKEQTLQAGRAPDEDSDRRCLGRRGDGKNQLRRPTLRRQPANTDPTHIGTSARCSWTPTIRARSGTCSTNVRPGFYEAGRRRRAGDGASVPGLSSAYLGAYKDKVWPMARWRRFVSPARATQRAHQAVLVGHALRCRHSRALILNEQKVADRSSRMWIYARARTARSTYIVDPKAPAGFKGANWIPTGAGRNWFSVLPRYQPTGASLDRSGRCRISEAAAIT